jgi:hypothetical protein
MAIEALRRQGGDYSFMGFGENTRVRMGKKMPPMTVPVRENTGAAR